MENAEDTRLAEITRERGSGFEGERPPPRSDESLELWDAWVSAEVECDILLEGWYSAPPEEKESAYIAYLAALDREDHAAEYLARSLGAGRRLSQGDAGAPAPVVWEGSS